MLLSLATNMSRVGSPSQARHFASAILLNMLWVPAMLLFHSEGTAWIWAWVLGLACTMAATAAGIAAASFHEPKVKSLFWHHPNMPGTFMEKLLPLFLATVRAMGHFEAVWFSSGQVKLRYDRLNRFSRLLGRAYRGGACLALSPAASGLLRDPDLGL